VLESGSWARSDGIVRILIASAPHADTFGYSMPPPGLLRLGGELARRGVAVELEDLAFRLAEGSLATGDGMARSASELLLAHSPREVLGLSVMGATLPIAIAIARLVRERAPDMRILFGGPGTGGVDGQLLERFPWIDAVVRGEGEETLPELLEQLDRGRDPAGVAGVTWRTANGRVVREPDRPAMRDLNQLPAPAWDLLPPLKRYKAITGETEGLTPIDSGRGCVFDCSFCSIGRYWSRRSRPLPAPRLAAEVAAVAEMPGGRTAYLCHDLFGADRDHALAVCDALEANEVAVPWECRARLDHMDSELAVRMASAGCTRVLLGVESADPQVRARNQKGMAADIDPLEVVDHCSQAGIATILSLILGLPGEDRAALARTLDLCADAALRDGVHISLHLANPQPGCALGEEFGARAHAPLEGVPPDMAWGAGESAPERALIAAHPDIFSTFALLPLPESELRELAAIAKLLPPVLHRYPRTFSLLRRRRGENALELTSAWIQCARSFESFARDARDPLVEDTLAWEQARVRAAVRGDLAGTTVDAQSPTHAPQRRVEVLRSRHDLASLTPALIAHTANPPLGRERAFVVRPPRDQAGAVGTLHVSDDVARLLDSLDGKTSLAELETAHPGLTRALSRLADDGLVAFRSLPSPATPELA